MRSLYKWILAFAAVAVLAVLLLYSCERKPYRPAPNTGLNEITKKTLKKITERLKDAEKIKAELAILKASKPKVVYKYRKALDSVRKASPDTCTPYIEAINKECMAMDSINNAIIAKQDSVNTVQSEAIAFYKDLVSLKDYSLSLKTDSLNYLEDENKRLRRKVNVSKGVGWLQTAGAAILGFFLGKAATK